MNLLIYLSFFTLTLMVCHGAPRSDKSDANLPTETQLDCIIKAVQDFPNLTDTIRACRPSVSKDPLGCLNKIDEIKNCFK